MPAPSSDRVRSGGSNVVFLLSSPRAGSTLLSAILNRHSKVLCPPEPWFLLSLHALYHGTVTGIAAYDQRLAGIGLHEFASEEEFLVAARAFASSLYDSRLQVSGRSLFVDKTPRYYHILPFLTALFPRARMIWLKRNPLDVAASYKTSWGVLPSELVGRDLSPYSFDLTLGLSALGAWFDGREGRCEISYEELVDDPDGVIGQVLEFLALEKEADLAEYGSDAESLDGFRRSSVGDRKVLEHSRPHASSVGRWRETLSAAELQELLVGIGTDTFDRMGYGDALAEASSRAGLRAGVEHRAPRHLEKLRLFQRWYAAALSLDATKTDQSPEERASAAPSDPRAVRMALLETRLAAAEADRAARLAVIEKQGAELGRIPGLEAEREALTAKLAACEADREARLAVIEKQGAELGRISGLEAVREALAARLAACETDREARLTVIEKQGAEIGALRAGFEEVRRRVEGAQPQTLLGVALPSEVRRLTEILSAISALVRDRTDRS